MTKYYIFYYIRYQRICVLIFKYIAFVVHEIDVFIEFTEKNIEKVYWLNQCNFAT